MHQWVLLNSPEGSGSRTRGRTPTAGRSLPRSDPAPPAAARVGRAHTSRIGLVDKDVAVREFAVPLAIVAQDAVCIFAAKVNARVAGDGICDDIIVVKDGELCILVFCARNNAKG